MSNIIHLNRATGDVTLGQLTAGSLLALDGDKVVSSVGTPTDGNVIVGDGSTWVAESGATARTSLGLGTTDSPQFTAVGVGIPVPLAKLDVVGTSRFGDSATNYTGISATGDVSFAGSAGFYPRVLDQTDEPAAGTGATQCDTGEAVIWTDTDDSKCYLCYNHGGTVKTVELG